MRAVAVLIDGELFSAQGTRISELRASETRAVATINHSRALDVPKAEGVDRIVGMLADIVAATRTLSPEDQRRVRDYLATTRSVLFSTGYLPENDQVQFVAALRTAMAKG